MYLACIALISVCAYVFSKSNVKKGNLWFLIFSGTVLFFYAALRNRLVGIDIDGYLKSYNKYQKYSFNEIIGIYNLDGQKDPTFYVLGWLFSQIFSGGQWWLAFIGGIYLSSVMIVIYKESVNPFISLLAFLSLGFFTFSLSGLRQTLAMSLTGLSYFGIKKRKPILFIIFVLLGSLFHSTALIFLIAYPMARWKLGLPHIISFVISIILFVSFQSAIRGWITKYIGFEHISNYGDSEKAATFSGFIIQFAIFVFALVYYHNVRKKYKYADILYNLSFIGLVFQLFSSMIAEFFRISMYFSFFNIILIPLVISAEPNKKISLLETSLVTLALVSYIFVSGVPEYSFFWQ